MTKKKKSVFSCQNCGCQRPRWEGRCPECGAWNSFVEESFAAVSPVHEDRQSWVGDTAVVSLDQAMEQVDIPRDSTGIAELDRTLGGGLARGSFVLVGGPPGIGKSTLLLQLSGGLAARGRKVLYVSGEESVQQTSGRAHRLGVRSPLITVASEANLNQIKAQIEKLDPEVVVIDSIQTLFLPELESAPGSVSQVRESAGRLLQMSKTQ
ncbi:MAG: ATPase domain-containing protein, partial [Bdellovibrio sp.]